MATLIIGGCGFIGSHICNLLKSQEEDLIIFDRNAEPELSSDGLIYVNGDFGNRGELSLIFEKYPIKYVIHLASSTLPSSSNLDPKFDVVSNICDTLSLLQQCVKHHVLKILFLSSGGTVYGIPSDLPVKEDHPTNPICSYGITKLAIEKYFLLFKHLYNLDFIIFRVGNPYGPGQLPSRSQGVVATFASKVQLGEEICIWGDGSVVRDFIFIQDLAKLCAIALKSQYSGIFNASSGKGYSIIEILTLIEKILNIKAKLHFEKSRDLDVPQIVLDSSRAQNIFKWRQEIDIEKGLLKTCDWIQSYQSLKSST
jgi:UDP-glucose 4-epimerase